MDILINSLGGGGAERQAAFVAKRLARRVLMLEKDRVYDPGVPVEVLSGAHQRMPRIRKSLMLPVQLVRALARMDGSPVLSFLVRANVLNVLAKLVRPHRAIVSERQALHEGGRASARTRLKLSLIGLSYRHADRVIVNSKGTADDLVAFCGVDRSRIRVVYNACDADAVRRQAQEAAETPKRYLVTSGRLAYQKGQDGLLRAFASASEDERDLELVILGTGPREEELRSLADDLGIRDRVRFVGFAKNPFPWIAQAEAFVLSSRYEGFPNVVLEALALGVPVIATDCPYGPRELLAPDTDHQTHARGVEHAPYGILVPPPGSEAGSEQHLADAMREAIRNGDLARRLREAGPQRAAAFAPEQILRDWEEALS